MKGIKKLFVNHKASKHSVKELGIASVITLGSPGFSYELMTPNLKL